eukprot:gnl/TRDRNA2_/TRDRNA2_177184_c0_seq3.p1 gnl/TRDRNA2_/TRDRNA2_177184_c0~~gnl/TRDRNA2_/TRDRNA2_177184_c0_seq3.p1  ORF type:complete len:379 (-),score=71.77 gnl/TRDRNA2_/TRDRNA2_177184_c0_seq3:264-1400(-)
MLSLILSAAILATANAAQMRGTKVNSTQQLAKVNSTKQLTFTGYYNSVKTGRGIWKWNDAVAAYDHHLLHFQGKPVVGAEVGVQSGGSLLMWHAVLGEKCTMHGLDINPDSVQFVDATTSITIGDQENPAMWESFFVQQQQPLDFLIDDGGHTAAQMLQTTYSVFPRLNPGGVLAIEDILGNQYAQPFFEPLAQYLGPNTDVASVHLYPYLVVLHKTGGDAPSYDPSMLPGANIPVSGKITDLNGVDAALAAAPPSSLIVLENPSWGRFINANGLAYMFRKFIDLYQPTNMWDDPTGCATTSASLCTTATSNNGMQAKITGVHILPNKLVIEVPAQEPWIMATRHGDKWVPPLKEAQSRLAQHLGNGPPARHYPQTGR